MLSKLLGAFTGNPVLMIYVACAIAAASLTIGAYSGWTLNGWRLGAKVAQVEKERDAAIAQANINAAAVTACNTSISSAKAAADYALKAGEKRLAEANLRAKQAEGQLTALDEYLKRPPPNAGCDTAWDIIERAAGVRP